MFSYDRQLAAAPQTVPQTIPGVLQVMQTIDATCDDGDGLKWFNWLYFAVTQAVEKQVTTGGFSDPKWLAELDVQFAALYFNALYGALAGGRVPGSWAAMFALRDQADIARIQFALAGMNAHINHDLPYAIVATCKDTSTVPRHGTPQYNDYTSINATLDGLIDMAKKQLNVRLLGGPLPAVSHLEDLIAAWNLADFREGAWRHAESMWQDSAFAAAILEGTMEQVTNICQRSAAYTGAWSGGLLSLDDSQCETPHDKMRYRNQRNLNSEHAQNGVRREPVPDPFGGVRRSLCAFKMPRGGRSRHGVRPRSSSLISVRHSATRIVLPDAICTIESGGIADGGGVPVRRVNADSESKARAVISSAAVVTATAVKRPASAIEIAAIEVSAEVPA